MTFICKKCTPHFADELGPETVPAPRRAAPRGASSRLLARPMEYRNVKTRRAGPVCNGSFPRISVKAASSRLLARPSCRRRAGGTQPGPPEPDASASGRRAYWQAMAV